MLRVRFYANYPDWRPVKFPPPGPCWCSGFVMDGSASIIVAYVETEEQITEFWPEAHDIDIFERDVDVTFTDRFDKPDWWNGNDGH